MAKLPIETKNPLFGKYLYPTAKDIMEHQQDVTWTAQEIPVDKDIQDYRHVLSASQLNLVTVTLQLFVEIEQKVGEVWEQIASWYPHSEIEGCCSEISRMEKSVHAFFYQKMSDTLNIDPEEVAKNQQTIQVLKSKLEFLTSVTKNLSKNKQLSLATVAMIEQVLLFSNFAMLKSFQANGNNYIKNTITGVDFVVQDEQIHGEFAAYLFSVNLTENAKVQVFDEVALKSDVLKILDEIITHEDAVIDYVFVDGASINGISADQLKTFVRSRANEVLTLLGYQPIFQIQTNLIADWFYRGSKSIKNHDFFAGITNQYRRAWKTENFSRINHLKDSHE